jgi:uncharacterized MAPEG superfamily protein
MTFELWSLVGAIALGFVHIGAQSMALKAHAGNAYTISARDQEMPVSGVAGRLDRALRNFNESFVLFAAAVLVLHVADGSGMVSRVGAGLYLAARVCYLPAYIVYVPWVRTVFWQLGMVGILLVLVQLALPA